MISHACGIDSGYLLLRWMDENICITCYIWTRRPVSPWVNRAVIALRPVLPASVRSANFVFHFLCTGKQASVGTSFHFYFYHVAVHTPRCFSRLTILSYGGLTFGSNVALRVCLVKEY